MKHGLNMDIIFVDWCRQPFSMSNASRMLQILDPFSLARLAGLRAVMYKQIGTQVT